MLHITGGDQAAAQLKRVGLPGVMLSWRDGLYEGPVLSGVPLETLSGIRARFLAASGWTDYESALDEFARRDNCLARFFEHDEVVLWFGHDLYEQLQLLQLLEWFSHQDSEDTQLSVINFDSGDGQLIGPNQDADAIQDFFLARREVTSAQLTTARSAWSAFCSPDPRAIEGLLEHEVSPLPYIRPVLRRHLEQFPAVGFGLCRTRRQILEAVEAGANEPDVLLQMAEDHESERFLAENGFWAYVTTLTRGPHPLLQTDDGRPFQRPTSANEFLDTPAQHLKITPAGLAVLEQRADAIALNGIDCWRGGVHLHHCHPHWRWDLQRECLTRVEPMVVEV